MTIAERQLSRRQALLGAGIVGSGALAVLMTAPAAAASERETGLEGAWLLKITVTSGPSFHFQVLTLNTKGGGVAAVSDSDPTSGTAGFGAWKSTESNTYLETFELFQFPFGPLERGILRVRAQSTLDKTGDTRSGQAHLDFQPVGQSFILNVQTTVFTGSRIKTLPL
jgi:hypothetical protein